MEAGNENQGEFNMARYTGPKIKLSRRVGQDLGHKQNLQKIARRLAIPPGQHGQKLRRGKRLTSYAQQLIEKQKVKFIYGVNEKQFRHYIQTAQRNPQETGEELIQLLERRLDNVIYRLGFAPTRNMGRQLVVHGHIKVNNQKINRPSFQVSVDDVVTLNADMAKIPDIQRSINNKDHKIPSWMQKKAIAGKITRLPATGDSEVDIDEQLVVEFYSR